MCLVLGPSGVGKTVLMKRLHKLCAKDSTDLGDLPPTQPTVGTNLTDLSVQRTCVTVREVGGSMVPIWPSYYKDCHTVLLFQNYNYRYARTAFGCPIPCLPHQLSQFIVDAANPNQVSASCIQLLSVLSAPALAAVSVLVIFNKTDLPCCMSLAEMKSLFRLDDIIASAKQPITVMETSTLEGTGLREVLQWLHSSTRH